MATYKKIGFALPFIYNQLFWNIYVIKWGILIKYKIGNWWGIFVNRGYSMSVLIRSQPIGTQNVRLIKSDMPTWKILVTSSHTVFTINSEVAGRFLAHIPKVVQSPGGMEVPCSTVVRRSTAPVAGTCHVNTAFLQLRSFGKKWGQCPQPSLSFTTWASK